MAEYLNKTGGLSCCVIALFFNNCQKRIVKKQDADSVTIHQNATD